MQKVSCSRRLRNSRATFLIIPLLIFSLHFGCSVEKKEASGKLQLISYEESGLDFKNELPWKDQLDYHKYSYVFNGGGVAIIDVDNDGLEDIFFTANAGNDQLYHNKGNLQFENISEIAGFNLNDQSWSTGVSIVDINDDGLQDIYICKAGLRNSQLRRNQLFINQGNLTFKEQALQFGLADSGWSSQACFFDYDNDGDLDCYLANHPTDPNSFVLDWQKNRRWFSSDKLYKNEGGKFIDVSQQANLHPDAYGFGLAVSSFDINRDGWQDIYVTNDFTVNDYMLINQQDGTFKDVQAESLKKMSFFSMGIDVADIENNGLLDFFVADMTAEDNYRSKLMMGGMYPKEFELVVNQGMNYQYMYNALQLNQGNMQFSEIGQLAGIQATDWSWSPLFVDFDNDGKKDLSITNGYLKDFRNSDLTLKVKKLEAQGAIYSPEEYLREVPSVRLKNYIFQNNGSLQFENKLEQWNASESSFSNGSAYADLDNDGDLDLVINNINDPAYLYENDVSNNNFIQLKLNGYSPNLNGIGTILTLTTDSGVQIQQIQSNRGFQSSSSLIAHFGLGKNDQIKSLEVLWPNGEHQTISDLEVNQKHLIKYEQSNPSTQQTQNLMFQKLEVEGLEAHHENEFDDFEQQVLLPHKLSRLGPKISKLNNKLLYVGGATNQVGNFYEFEDVDHKIKVRTQQNNLISSEETSSYLIDIDDDGMKDLVLCNGSYEYDSKEPGFFVLNNNAGKFDEHIEMPTVNAAVGTIIDFVNEKGRKYLLAFERLVPGRYPMSADVHVLLQTNDSWLNLTGQVAQGLADLGMVTDAKVLDLDQDGKSEILVLGEWMSPRVIEQEVSGAFIISDRFKGLSEEVGWWNCIEPMDIDKDGDMDFIAGNLGLNYKYKATHEKPFNLYHGDLDQNGTYDIILSYENFGNYFPVRGFSCSSEQMPSLGPKLKTYHKFASSTTESIYGEQLNNAQHIAATNFSSSVFINDGQGNFIQEPLPISAQISVVNAIVSYDFNKDGYEDLIIGGNMHEAEIETPKADAGKGLLLINNRKGGFEAIEPSKSGLYLDGNLRDLDILEIEGQVFLFASFNNALPELWKINSSEIKL